MEALNQYNKTNYPDHKTAWFEEPIFHEATQEWTIVLNSPPHYRGMLGNGKTVEEAKTSAANLWIELWEEWDAMKNN